MPQKRWKQKLFQARSWFRYWLEAVNEHSLHPPFIYALYEEAIKPAPLRLPAAEAIRQRLLHSKETIQLHELGAGSSISKRDFRSVASIAKHSLTPAAFSSLLYRLIQHCQANIILELGTSLGINTLYLAAAAPTGVVHTLEGCPSTAAMAANHFASCGASNIRLHTGNIDMLLPQLLKKELAVIDLAYLDANHTFEATTRYFEWLLPHLHEKSVLVVDDIHWSEGMQQAWKRLCRHPAVSLSIDLYEAGLLFFKPQLHKQHWVIEY